MRFERLSSLVLAALVMTAGNAMAAGPTPEAGDSTRVYTFDDLRVNCGWNVTTSGLYRDLEFPDLVHMAVCNTPNGSIGLVPSREGIVGRLEVRVGLPVPATAVSIDSYLYSIGEAPTLIAYDSTGVELGRSSNGAFSTWVTLEVQAGDTPIAEVGLLMPQLRTYLDNLTVVPAAVEPEPEPLPEPDEESTDEQEPTPVPGDPVVTSDCFRGGWEGFGFRNQGECVRFAQTGKDSR